MRQRQKMGASVDRNLFFCLRVCISSAEHTNCTCAIECSSQKLLTFTNKIKTIHQNQSPRKCIFMLSLTNAAGGGRIPIIYAVLMPFKTVYPIIPAN